MDALYLSRRGTNDSNSWQSVASRIHGLVFTTRNGRPIDQRNVSRAFHRARTDAGVDNLDEAADLLPDLH